MIVLLDAFETLPRNQITEPCWRAVEEMSDLSDLETVRWVFAKLERTKRYATIADAVLEALTSLLFDLQDV